MLFEVFIYEVGYKGEVFFFVYDFFLVILVWVGLIVVFV